MSINVHSADTEDSELNTTINTTPLVDVMLVMLIIFLITVPVIVKVTPVQLAAGQMMATCGVRKRAPKSRASRKRKRALISFCGKRRRPRLPRLTPRGARDE